MCGAEPMKRGRFKTKVSIEEQIVRNELEGQPSEWKEVRKIKADIRPLRGKEYQLDHQTKGETTHKAWTRVFDGASTAVRWVVGSRVFHVDAVFDIDERHRWLQWMLTETT